MNGTPFRGVFYKIGKHFPYVPITKLVNVTTSGDMSGRGNPVYVIDPHFTILDAANWVTISKINSSYKFTFLRNSLRLTSYSIKSRTDHTYNLPNELIIEGSNDDNDWTLLHHKEADDTLGSPGKTGRWYCNTNNFFRSFKITQIGKNYNSFGEHEAYVFGMNKLEVYGKFDIELICPTYYQQKIICLSPALYIIINRAS